MASRTALKEWRETYGMKRDEAKPFIDANMDFTQASEWLAASFEPYSAAMYYSERISIEDALRYQALSNGEMDERHLSLYRELGISVDEVEEWVRRGFSYTDPIMFTSYPFTEGEPAFLMGVHGVRTLTPYTRSETRRLDKDLFVRDYDTAWQWRHAGFTGLEASEWIHHEFSPEEAAIWREMTRDEYNPNGNASAAYTAVRDGFTPEEFLPWADIDWRPRQWIDAGFTPEEVSAWMEACVRGFFYAKDVVDLIALGMTPDDVKPWSEAWVDFDDVVNIVRAGYSLDQVKEWTARGYRPEEILVTGEELLELRLKKAKSLLREVTCDIRDSELGSAREAWERLSREVEGMFAEMVESPVEV